MKNKPPKTIVIIGPTASGKSDLAISLARKYDGEIISADSRQVYRGMDIGTGKVIRDPVTDHPTQGDKFFYSEGIRHHLIDVASPKRSYNVTHFVRDGKKALADIHKRGKVAIICGGTGFWAQALIEDNPFPAVKPNPTLRKELGTLSAEELFVKLKALDPERARTIDPRNKVRLVRALEIVAVLGKVPTPETRNRLPVPSNFFILVLNPSQHILHQNIATRLGKRMRQGMVEEVERLRQDGVSWKRLEGFGLEYKYLALFLQGKLSREAMLEALEHEIRHYAKRQLTYFRRMEKQGLTLHWVSDAGEAEVLIKKSNAI